MSETVDNVLDTINDTEPTENNGGVVITEEAVTEEAVTGEAATEEAVTGEAVTEEAVTEEAVTEDPVSVQEVVQNVQEILKTPSSDLSDKERIVNLEKKVEELIEVIKYTHKKTPWHPIFSV